MKLESNLYSLIEDLINHVYFVFSGIESVYEWKGEVWIRFPH